MKDIQPGQNQDIAFIHAQPPFDSLSEAELKRVEQTLETARFSPGTHFLQQGGPPSQYLYMIGDGAVRLVRNGQVAQVLEEGEFFGYPSLINQISPSFDVVAEEETLVYQIPARVFHELVDNAEFAEFFLKSLSERLRQAFKMAPSPLGSGLTAPVEMLIIRSPITVGPMTTAAEAAQIMRRAWVDSAIVLDDPPGIITDHDFLFRLVARALGPDAPVHTVMSRPLKTLPADTPVHGALLFMLEENIHHLALTREGEIIGVVTATDLLRHQAKSPLYLVRQLANLETTGLLERYGFEIAGVVETLFEGGLDVAQIGRVVAGLNDTLLRRLLRLAEAELGPPPTPYAWLVFGSEGRMEQALLTDQDNALVYLEETVEAQNYFANLTGQVVDNLIRAGFPPCPGGYMATKWRYPLARWTRLFRDWIETPNPQALLETAIFFDFRAVYGQLSVEPLERIILETSEQKIFLAHLTSAALEFRPPLGFFRRIRGEDGLVDLKMGGIAPVVSLARLYALEARARTRSTFDRVEIASAAGSLSQNGAETLAETYRFLLRLRLREQLATLKTGHTPNNKAQLDALSPLEKRNLKDAFMAIREMQEAASRHFNASLLG